MIRDLSGGFNPLSFGHLLHVEDICIFMVQGQRINVDDFRLIHLIVQNASDTLQEAPVNHHNLICFLHQRAIDE